jgi:hypothetical protein
MTIVTTESPTTMTNPIGRKNTRMTKTMKRKTPPWL